MMEPIAVWEKKNGEWAIIHRCRVCGALSSNRIAADDNPMKLMSLAMNMKPASSPLFPLERIEVMTLLMGGDGELKWRGNKRGLCILRIYRPLFMVFYT